MAGDFSTPPTLFYFCVFRNEDIVFFHPPTFSADDRQKHVGLSLGLMAFARYGVLVLIFRFEPY